MTDLKISETPQQAGVQALKAGLDSELPTPYGYNAGMLKFIEKDEKAQAAFDRAVKKVIEAKVKLGLFERPAGREELLEEAYNRTTGGMLTQKGNRIRSRFCLSQNGDFCGQRFFCYDAL